MEKPTAVFFPYISRQGCLVSSVDPLLGGSLKGRQCANVEPNAAKATNRVPSQLPVVTNARSDKPGAI